MKTLKIIILIIIFTLICFVKLQYEKINELKENIKISENNVSQLESENYSLIFNKGKLEDYIKENNTQLKIYLDSITKLNNIKLKDITKIIHYETKIKTIDTIFIEVKVEKKDSNYISKFELDSLCIKLEGEIISKDPNINLLFTNIESNNNIDYFVYKEPKKWWKIFKKRKLIVKTISKCGTVTYKELSEK